MGLKILVEKFNKINKIISEQVDKFSWLKKMERRKCLKKTTQLEKKMYLFVANRFGNRQRATDMCD